MDSITQAALGGLCGELVLRRQLGWKGALWGVFFGTVPDLDIFMSPWLDSMDGLRNHRSLSHSLFLMLLMSPLFGWLLSRLHKSVSYRRATGFVLLTWATHVLIDCFNSYGTQVLEPFSDYRVAFGNMAIVDLFFTIPMLIGNFLCLFCLREGRARSWITWTTTAWISLYVLASVLFLNMARAQFETRLNTHNISHTDMLISPTLSNIFLWRMVARNEEQYFITYWSLFDSDVRPVHIETIEQSPEIATPYLGSKAFNTLEWFSKGWWKVFQDTESPNSIYFVDLRFGESPDNSYDPPVKSPPFLWKLTLEKDGSVTDQRTRLIQKEENGKPFEKLATFVFGTQKERVMGRALHWQQGVWPWDPAQ
ncbi:metal-dependent hydrolase [Rubritalea sp.]|uniref:metal-dependent hydrolase n=1 Tax=Rubritalea sp. TaxID=2109375 RepID=UPI003EF4E7CB